MSFFEIFKPAYKSKNPENRLQAVTSLADQQQLATLAMSDTSPRVRNAAVRKISDQELLFDVALNGKEIDSRIIAVEQIKSQEKLAEIIKIRKNFQLLGACFSKITDKDILQKIAYDTEYNMSARRLAIEQFADEAYLKAFEEKSSIDKKTKSKEEIDSIITKYGGDQLVHALGKFRGSKNAMKALGELLHRGGTAAHSAVEQLAKGLLHANLEIAQEAEKQLISIKDPDLIALLVRMIQNKELQDKVLSILRKIDHEDAREIVNKYNK
jgi:hypothetical protein